MKDARGMHIFERITLHSLTALGDSEFSEFQIVAWGCLIS